MNYSTNRPSYARWASEDEIKQSLCKVNFNETNRQCSGIPLYTGPDEQVYVDPSDTHTMIIGSTGSKKSRNIVMPSLQILAHAGESFIATDPKAELYERSLNMLRKMGLKPLVINLRDPRRSNCWNPLTIPYRLYRNGERDRSMELVTDLANCMVKEDSANEPYWQNSAADLLAGMILILFECAKESEINFKSLLALRIQALKINDSSPFIKENFLDCLDRSAFVASLLSGTAEVCDDTRSCIVSHFDQAMRPFFSQDSLINMLSVSDFDMSSIGKKKTAVFLIIPDENTLYHRLISVFVKQCYTELILEAQKQPGKRLPVRVNFMLDEFASLPPISDFPAMITASRSRNIRFNLIVQSLHQLRHQYGDNAEIIKGNCENWVFLYSRELQLLEELVRLAGTKSNEEPLITVPMLQTLDKNKGEALVLHKRLHPFIASLKDIDQYRNVSNNVKQIPYPVNTVKAENVFDFNKFCKSKSSIYLSLMFSGKTEQEISMEEEKRFMSIGDDDAVLEPLFTSVISDDREIEEFAASAGTSLLIKER
uniref:Putative conjugation protein n=1 Tax=uncultured bacterium contig00019 TaxID=1181510 RepID=A0A806K033_9BACT|nr:putative conjugation protein [uncultured bacterium contig00019]